MSKTMRLDILPNVVGGPFAPSALPDGGAETPPRPTFNPALFQHLFRHAYDASLITDEAGTILEGNLRAHEFLVRENEELFGLNIVKLISGADDGLVTRLTATLASERFARIHAWCQRTDGGYFPAEIAVHCIEVDQRKHLCFFIRDITWRKEAEGQLQTVNIAIRNARTGIATADLQGRIVYANPAMASLCQHASEESLREQDLADLLAQPEVARQIVATVSAGQAWSGEVQLRRPDGSTLTTQCDAAVNVDTENEIIGLVLSFVDVTDRQRVQQAERAIERNRVMMESLGSVCHHLGQPSTVLLSSIEMMMRLKDKDAEAMDELLQLSLSAAESLRNTLRELNELRHYRSEPYLAHSQPHGRRIVTL